MRIFKTKPFSKWAAKAKLTDKALVTAVEELNNGLHDAKYGGNVFKKRVALSGRGKSSSTRTIVAFKVGDRAFFIYGFEKNAKSNIDEKEEKALKKLAKEFFSYSDQKIKQAIKHGELIEIEVTDE